MLITIERRIAEAREVLKFIGMPNEQLNDRTAICLLALLNLSVEKSWNEATNPQIGIRAILDFARDKLNTNYAENTRESIRKYSVKQLVNAGVLLINPDHPIRPTNSSKTCYQIEDQALTLFRQLGSTTWEASLSEDLLSRGSLSERYAQERIMNRLPLKVNIDKEIKLSAGDHSTLIRSIIYDFGSTFLPGGELVYVGDTGSKWGYFDAELLKSLGVSVTHHGKMPDVVIYDRVRNWLVLAESVTSSGPVDGDRHAELANLFKDSTAGLVFVSAFPDRGEIFRKFLSVVAWETEVWCASDITHIIHFNGSRFLGPYTKH